MKLIILLLLILSYKIILNHANNELESTNVELENTINEKNVIDFLIWNHYLDVNSTELHTLDINNEDVIEAIMSLQEFYKINDDGKLNAETLALINSPKCGFPDISPQNYMLASEKWNKTNLSWNFINSNYTLNKLTQTAFDTWQKHSSYIFKHKRMANHADIVISFKSHAHNFSRCCNRQKCYPDFDGIGHALAHAYMPSKDLNILEIHMDEDEAWEYSESGSFYQTLLHEIGHTLGLHHSSVKDSVMYSFFHDRNTTDLTQDDIFAIQQQVPKQNLSKTAITKTSPAASTTLSTTLLTSTTTTTKPTTASKTEMLKHEELNICTYEKELKTFLIANGRFYIIHKNLVWMRDIKDSILHKPDFITNWLQFIPKNFTEISIIYQQSDSEIVMIIHDLVYVVKIPSLKLVHSSIKTYNFFQGLPQQIKINSVFNSYLDYEYIIYNDIYVGKIDKIRKIFESLGFISDYFPGVPARIEGVYRNNDGNLHFIANDFIYVYNEFTKSIIKSIPRNARAFDVECPNKSILEKLQDLLSQILYRQIQV